MAHTPPPTVVNADPAGATLSPEELLRRQADLAELAFGSFAGTDAPTGGSPHLAFLPPEELALDLDDPAQRELGDYTLIEKLGHGGMGVVYRAHQKSLDRDVALKLLSAGPWASRDFIERFRREAQSAARMQHPNIVAIYEIGRHEELNFFSMRLVRGPSLASRLTSEGPLPPRQAAQLLATVAEAVDYAHRLAVLHLDLKPGNVLIDELGQPLVADFGLARRMDESLGHDSDEVSGTPSYMAPEQAQLKSHRLSAATDIYGLGAILYETLTGRPPFLGPTPQETLVRVAMLAPEPPGQLREGIPADLDAICLKCLAKAPQDRYSSARALADDLLRFLDGRAVSVRTPGMRERVGRWARREPRVALAAGAFLLALLSGLVATSQQWRRAEGNAQASRELLWESRREAALRAEQDGRGFEALPRLLDNLHEQERDGSDAGVAMERRRIGMLLGQGARLIDRVVIADANPMAVEVSPDGRRVAVALNDLTVRWYDSATLGELGRVSLDGRPTSDGQPRAPILLRFVGNDRLRVTLDWYGNLASPTDGDTWLVDLASGKLVEPPPAFANFADANFSADGRLALLRNQGGHVQVWQVEPWLPLSPVSRSPDDSRSWLIDPRGRFVVNLSAGMRQVRVRSLPGLEPVSTIAVPNNSGISAWSLSADGRHLAVGDFEGRIFLVDTASWAMRPLASGRGREIIWLSYSEDDAWLVSANFDGTVQAFDVATGDALAAGQMRHDFPVQRVGVSRAQRLLVVAGAGQTALWRLSRVGVRALPPHRIGLAPAPHGLAARYPVGWSLETGLLASVGMDGQARLWRLPASPTLEARAAHQVPERVRHAGRLVDVAWNQVRLADPDGRRHGPWLALPQPPGYAELVDGDRLLLLTLGPTLHAYDAATMRLRYPPLALPDSPQRLLANADGSRVVLSFGGLGAQGLEDRLRLLDARTGRWLPGAANLRGELMRLAWSGDERRLLAIGPTDGATTVLDAATLAVIGEYPHDPFEPVVWAAFDGERVALATRADDRRLGSDSLIYWNPVTDHVDARHDTGLARPRGVLAAPGGLFLLGAQADLLFGRDGRPLPLQRLATSEPSALSALSPDGLLLARGFRRELQLFDAATGEAVGPPLVGDNHPLDYLAVLSFSPSGDALFARTMQGRWLRWPVAAEARPVASLRADLERLGRGGDTQATLYPPTAAERRALRAGDPGHWPASASRPAPALAANAAPDLEIPARIPGTPAHLVDLGPVYDVGPESVNNTYYSFRPSLRAYPMGVQRIAGVEFDMRGLAHVGPELWAQDPAAWRIARPIRCLALPPARAAAVHLLAGLTMPTSATTGTPVALLTLHYADGGRAQVPLRAGIELPGYAGDDSAVPVTFAPDPVLPMSGYAVDGLATPRLANPEPQRALRCLDLETTGFGRVLALFGLTLEAVPGAVIAGNGSGSNLVTAPLPTWAGAPADPRRSP